MKHFYFRLIFGIVWLAVAGLIGMWPVGIWVFLCIVLIEVLSLPLITRRI